MAASSIAGRDFQPRPAGESIELVEGPPESARYGARRLRSGAFRRRDRALPERRLTTAFSRLSTGGP